MSPGLDSGFNIKTVHVGPLDVVHCRERDLIAFILKMSKERLGAVISYAHLHTLAMAWASDDFAALLNQCDLCYCDGRGVSYASFLLNTRWLHKVTANSFVLDLRRYAVAGRWRIALVGGDQVALSGATAYFTNAGVSVVYAHHGYIDDEGENVIRKDLMRLKPDVILIGMGQPKQEKLAVFLRRSVDETIILCVGGLFDFLAGKEWPCPAWVRRVGFECIIRLVSSPRRLANRYLKEGPCFLFRLAAWRISGLSRNPGTRIPAKRCYDPNQP